MKIAVNQPMLNVDGTEFKIADKTLLLVDIVINSLTATLEEENKEEGVKKLKKWELAKKFESARGATIELSLEEAVFIKERISKTHITLIYGNVHEMFEQSKE